jgi:hypothetical protein
MPYAPMLSSGARERITALPGRASSRQDGEARIPGNELETYLNSLGKENLKHALVYIAGRLTA